MAARKVTSSIIIMNKSSVMPVCVGRDHDKYSKSARQPIVSNFNGETAPELFSDGRPILCLRPLAAPWRSVSCAIHTHAHAQASLYTIFK